MLPLPPQPLPLLSPLQFVFQSLLPQCVRACLSGECLVGLNEELQRVHDPLSTW